MSTTPAPKPRHTRLMDDREDGPDWHAEADRTFGPCGDPDCPSAQAAQQAQDPPARQPHLRVVDKLSALTETDSR